MEHSKETERPHCCSSPHAQTAGEQGKRLWHRLADVPAIPFPLCISSLALERKSASLVPLTFLKLLLFSLRNARGWLPAHHSPALNTAYAYITLCRCSSPSLRQSASSLPQPIATCLTHTPRLPRNPFRTLLLQAGIFHRTSFTPHLRLQSHSPSF